MSVRNLLEKEDPLFDLLEASARQAQSSVRALAKSDRGVPTPNEMDEIAFSRLKDRALTEEIKAAVSSAFHEVLQKDDIEQLSDVLYKIPKNVEKFAALATAASQYIKGIDFSRQIELLERTTNIVLTMVQSLRAGWQADKTKDLNRRLQDLEGEADRHMLFLYRDLFSGRHDAVRVLALKDLYELLEKLIDRCRDTGNVIGLLVLKNA